MLNQFIIITEELNKRTCEDSRDGPRAENPKLFDETENLTPTNSGFRTKNHCVATYDQTNKVLSWFYPAQIVEAVGSRTLPL